MININLKPTRVCKNCNKKESDHLAKTHNCPIGRKCTSVGYTSYSLTEVFEPKGTKDEN